jgi:hypothetical protein
LITGVVGAFAGCEAGGSRFDSGSEGNGGPGAGQGGGLTIAASSGTGGAGMCFSDPTSDQDQDGFTGNEGDCNDCDPNVNPGAIEVIASQGGGGGAPPMVDEDCDGTIDNPPAATCDTGLALDSSVALDGAKAIELCHEAPGPKDYGVVSATYVRADGTSAAPSPQYGILSNFGPNVPPQAGASMLGLSSGHARIPGQPNECGSCTCSVNGLGTPPPGFPQNAPGCVINQAINDDIGLEVELRSPTNATGYAFDFKFYSFEFAEWVCTDFNDQFMALVTPPPMGSLNGNVSFDMSNNPVSVNIAFFDSCTSCANWAENCLSGCPPQPNPCCPAGAAELQGTGFDNWTGTFDNGEAGATAWLRTTVPVAGAETFKIRFAIWDTGDTLLDATVVVDNFQWIASGGSVTVGTVPVPE